MRTLTDNFETEKNKLTGAAPRTLIEIVTSTGTVYYSDQELTVSGQDYTPKVLQWGPIKSQIIPGNDVIPVSSFNVRLTNYPRIDNIIDPGQKITVYCWNTGLVAADKSIIFEGYISDGLIWDPYEISFSCSDSSDFYDNQVGNPLSLLAYPNVDPDDINKTIPIIYGEVKNNRCLAIDAGAASTLWEDIAVSASTIKLTDASRFPASGTVILGAEEDITYSGKSGNNLTGVANVSQAYSAGTLCWEKKSSMEYLVADHPVESITNPRILPFGRRLQDAVAIDQANYTVNTDNAGKATISLTSLPAIRKSVLIDITQQPIVDVTTQPDQPITTQPVAAITTQPDQPITTQPVAAITTQPDQPITTQPDQPITTQQTQVSPSHSHTPTASNISVFFDSITMTGITAWSWISRLVDGNLAENGEVTFGFGGSGDVKIQKSLVSGNAGSLGNATLKVRCKYSGTDDWTFQFYWKNSLKVTKTASVTSTATTFTSASFSLSGESWSDFQDGNTYIKISFPGSLDYPQLDIYEAWVEVTNTPPAPTQAATINQSVAAVSNQITAAVSNRTTDAVAAITQNVVSNRTTDAVAAITQNVVSNRTTDAVTTRTTDTEIGGDSVADSLGGYLIVDCQGWKDDTSGHYTGSSGNLIEKPWDVIHHLIETYSNSGNTESLNELEFTTHIKWDVTGDMIDSGGNAKYTHSTGSGTLSQTNANMAVAGVGGKYYRFSYEVSGVTGNPVATITTAFAKIATKLPLTAGRHTITVLTTASPTAFTISATSSSGGFTIDNVTLKEVNHDSIDLTTFADARSNLPMDYRFSFIITNRIWLNKLLTMVARQTWCRMLFDAGQYKLVRIKTISDISQKSINLFYDGILKNGKIVARVNQRSLSDIKNSITIRYDIDYSLGGWKDNNAYEGLTSTTSASSINTYGERRTTINMFAVGDNLSMAENLRNKHLAYLENTKKELSFLTYLKHYEIERGDIVDITSTQLGMSSEKYEVREVEYTPPTPIKKQGPMIWLKLIEV